MTDPFTGSMLGLAIGDALGAPFEGLKEGHIRQTFGEVTGYADSIAAFPDRPGRWRLRGLYTDDTQQALAVAEVLAVYGEADLDALATLYLRLANEGPSDSAFGAHRGTGHFFRRAVRAMAENGDPLACGQPSAGNGAAMRIAPVGLYYAGDCDAMAEAALRISLMTHHDPRAVAAALALAWTVGRLASDCVSSTVSSAADMATELFEWVAEREEWVEAHCARYEIPERHGRLSSVLGALPSLAREGNDDLAAKTILQLANACDPREKIAHPHAGFAPASVPMALYRALTASDFSAGLLGVVCAGGDADTVGAMAGALLGARFGIEAIAPDWIAGLLNSGGVRARGAAMRDREADWARWDDYVETEIALCEREATAVRAALARHGKAIDKRTQRLAERRNRAANAAARTPAPDLGFAPPPEVWLHSASLEPRETLDPIEARKQRAKRGRKRVEWKEARRQKQRMGSQSTEEDSD